jgi:membrane protein required for colicin V production
MTDIDWIIAGVLLLSALVSLWRGFVKEAMSLLGWVVAFVLAVRLSPALSSLMHNWISHDMLRLLAAMVLLFVGTLLVFGLVNHLIVSLLKRTGLGPIDRILGMVFGALRGAILVLVCLIVLPMIIGVEEQDWWQRSVLIPKFLILEDWALATFGDIAGWRKTLLS